MGTSETSSSGQRVSADTAAADLTIDHGWSAARRRIVTVGLLIYLMVLIAGPLSNPLGSEFLTRPIAKSVSPVHQVLFMGHGYRFFGPDPGNSHIVEYTIAQADGSTLSGHFPDRDSTWPRLLYHRWFMLSETIYNEHLLTPIEEDFERQQNAILEESRRLKLAGNHDQAASLIEERTRQRDEYAATRKRIDLLVKGVAKGLMSIHGNEKSQQIELFVREREIPFPQEVLAGAKLDDPKYLVPEKPLKVAEFTTAQLADKSVEAEELPGRAVQGGGAE
jgi:hypothetical protein